MWYNIKQIRTGINPKYSVYSETYQKMIEETFKSAIKRYGLVEKKDRILLGVSGGPDSICMLHQFYNIMKEYKLQLVCAHFNHQLREEADSEEEFVKNICDELGLKFISEKKDVKSFFKGDSLEQTARILRYDFFLKISRHFKIKKISLAHHKDDLIETVLMRIIRGSGLKGLIGFLPKSKFKSLTVIRPLIEVSKEDILNWCKTNKIEYCTDKTNFEDKFLRNRLRLKVLKELEGINPNISENLYNLSRNVSLDYDFINTYCRGVFAEIKKGETQKTVKLDLAGLKQLHPAILNNIVRMAIEELKGDTRRIELKHIDEIRDLIFNRPVLSVVDLPFIRVRKEHDKLLIQSLIL